MAVMENDSQQREGGPTKHQDRASDTKIIAGLGQTQHSADRARPCGPHPPEGAPSKEKPGLKEPSEKRASTGRSDRSALRADVHRESFVELYPPETAKVSDNCKNLPSTGRTHPDSYVQAQTLEKAWGPCAKTYHKDGQDEARCLAREDSSLNSARIPCEREVGKMRSSMEPKPEAPAARCPLQPLGIDGGKSEKLSSFSSLQKEGPKEPDRKEQPLQRHVGSDPQRPLTTKDLPSLASRQQCSSPSHTCGREPGTKPSAPEPAAALQDPPRPAVSVHSESSEHSLRPGPDPSPSKSKHPDRSFSSQKSSVGTAKGKEPVTQPLPGSSRDGKSNSKGGLDVCPALPGSQSKASEVGGGGESVPFNPLHAEESPLDPKLKPTSGRGPEMQEKQLHLPRQGHLGFSESADHKPPAVSEKQSLSPKHPKPSTVKDCPPLCRQTDRSPSQQAPTTDRKLEGKKCTEALYVPAADSGKLEAGPSLAHGEARLKGTEKPGAVVGKGFPEAKGKGPGPQKVLPEAGKLSGMKRSPSATGQSSFRSAALPEKPLSSSSSFPEARPGVRDAATTSSSSSSAKANGATLEPPAPSNRDHRKSQSGADGRTQMTKSDSLPSFRLSPSALESQHSDAQGLSGVGHRDRALSVTAATGETKGREPAPAQPPPPRKQNVGREATKAPQAPNSDRPITLSSEKDFVVRQRRGKESLRSSPHKKAS